MGIMRSWSHADWCCSCIEEEEGGEESKGRNRENQGERSQYEERMQGLRILLLWGKRRRDDADDDKSRTTNYERRQEESSQYAPDACLLLLPVLLFPLLLPPFTLSISFRLFLSSRCRETRNDMPGIPTIHWSFVPTLIVGHPFPSLEPFLLLHFFSSFPRFAFFEASSNQHTVHYPPPVYACLTIRFHLVYCTRDIWIWKRY